MPPFHYLTSDLIYVNVNDLEITSVVTLRWYLSHGYTLMLYLWVENNMKKSISTVYDSEPYYVIGFRCLFEAGSFE